MIWFSFGAFSVLSRLVLVRLLSRGSHLFGYLPDRLLFVCLLSSHYLTRMSASLRTIWPGVEGKREPTDSYNAPASILLSKHFIFSGSPAARVRQRSDSVVSFGDYSKSAYSRWELKETKPDIINDRWAPAGLNKWILPKVLGEKLCYFCWEKEAQKELNTVGH